MAKLVYIAHPVSGDIKGNIEKILNICSIVHREDNEVIPFAPYLVALSYLDDRIIEERNLGILANVEHFKRKTMDEVWLCGPNISNGMTHEIKLAVEYGIPIVCYNPELNSSLNQLLEKINK